MGGLQLSLEQRGGVGVYQVVFEGNRVRDCNDAVKMAPVRTVNRLSNVDGVCNAARFNDCNVIVTRSRQCLQLV